MTFRQGGAQRGLDRTNAGKITDYLFGEAKKGEELDYLLMRMDAGNEAFSSLMLYYTLLNKEFDSKIAGTLGLTCGALSISKRRLGRIEGTEALNQPFPKTEMIPVGISTYYPDQKE